MSMRVAIAVPSLNQAAYLNAALDSIGRSHVPLVSAVLDGGSTDGSRAIIESHAGDLAFWRSAPDAGQAAAINEGIARLLALYPDVDAVGWLNADDFYLDDGLDHLAQALADHPEWVAVSGRGALASERGLLTGEIATAPFSRERFAHACTICQPATLVRRSAWERAGGLDLTLDMCFDYDLWWRVARLGIIGHLDVLVAASRDHGDTKTRQRRARYFHEAVAIVRREVGDVPWHWYISEALERQTGYAVGERPGPGGSTKAAVQAGAAFVRDKIKSLFHREAMK
jgi:GT2 family glycosyltransferase